MRRRSLLAILLLLVGLLSAASIANAQGAIQAEIEALKRLVGELQTKVEAQQRKIEALEAKQEAAAIEAELKPTPPPPPSAPATPSPGGRQPASAGGHLARMPQIGVVGDIVYTGTERSEDADGNDRFRFRELELVLGDFVDPYTRFDAAVVWSEGEEVEIEEAFVTHFGLPYGLGMRLGKFRPRIGRINLKDLNALPFVNEPLVISEYFGAEGFAATGLELSRFLPNPWDLFVEGSLAIVDGGNDVSFGGNSRRPILVGHLRSFFDFSDRLGLQLALTGMLGSTDVDRTMEAFIGGASMSWHYQPREFLRLTWLTEAYGQDRRQEAPGIEPNPLGFFSNLDLRFHPRWSVGARYDFVEPLGLARDDGDRSQAIAGYLTFHQSEFALFRLQLQHSEFASGRDDDAIFLQTRVQIGVDRHALQ